MLVLGVCLVTILLLAEIFCLAIDEITILLRAFVQAQVTTISEYETETCTAG